MTGFSNYSPIDILWALLTRLTSVSMTRTEMLKLPEIGNRPGGLAVISKRRRELDKARKTVIGMRSKELRDASPFALVMQQQKLLQLEESGHKTAPSGSIVAGDSEDTFKEYNTEDSADNTTSGMSFRTAQKSVAAAFHGKSPTIKVIREL